MTSAKEIVDKVEKLNDVFNHIRIKLGKIVKLIFFKN